MIYRNQKEIRKLVESHKNKPIWACAYELQYGKNGNRLVQKPVQGEIYDSGFRTYFAPYRKGSKELAKSKEVLAVWSRYYADTSEECVELYNSLIDDVIRYFWKRISECWKDRIPDPEIKIDTTGIYDVYIDCDEENKDESN